jgi:hypothetical protein
MGTLLAATEEKKSYYAIGHNTKKCYKGILNPIYGTPIKVILENLLNIGVVVSLVSKEKYDAFDPKDVSMMDLAGWIQEGEMSL